MDTAFQKETYRSFTLCWSGGVGGETDAECVVPDSMPDVGSIVDCDAIVSIRSKESDNGRLRAGVDLSVHVLYQPEDGTDLRSLPLNMSCELNAAAAEIDNQCHCQVLLRLRVLEARVINSRKISLHAELSGHANCYRRQELTLAQDVAAPSLDLQILKKKAEFCMVSDLREKTFVITGDYELPNGIEDPGKILLQRVQLQAEKCEFVAEKLIFRGKAQVFLLLQSENGPQPCQFSCDFSQVMELDGGADPSPQVSLMLTGAYFDLPEHGGGKLSYELHILAQTTAMKTVEPDYIADIYSNQQALTPIKTTARLCDTCRELVLEKSIDSRSELPPDVQYLLYTKALVSNLSFDKDSLALSIQVKAVYRRSDGSFGAANVRLKENLSLSLGAGEQTSQCHAFVGDILASLSGGQLELRVPIVLHCCLYQDLELSHVCDLEESEEALPNCASLTLLYATEDDDLWMLAKNHRSTCDAIRAANDGRESGLLLIPRAR